MADIEADKFGVVRARRAIGNGETVTITPRAYELLYLREFTLEQARHVPNPMKLVADAFVVDMMSVVPLLTPEDAEEVGPQTMRVLEPVSFIAISLDVLPARVRSDSQAQLTYREREALVSALIEERAPPDILEWLQRLPNPLVVARLGDSEAARVVERA